MLGHGTAAHWRGLIDYAPREIQVNTPRQVPSLKGTRVYGRRPELVHGNPVEVCADVVGALERLITLQNARAS